MKNLTYKKAFSDLEKLVDQIEDDEIQLDTLADKVKQANELIKFCETNLRSIEKDVEVAMGEGKKGRKKG
ncbi:MAG: exodeoxyribonuclease VII small subunit [Bacteroidota bacterium]|nr:exodeoxyribonuclease VII small subunit [Bacteroidota bacterium]